ncbi:hypothetical protein Q5H92_03560 [Hymenobacter sp. M29]|uniref:Uncharacterized protein n=1 Tax=Hymenobacter mellowenesis TaxID=3063995 RepID=A0ABT9A8Y3_9BACT|nr:hypothetical protein [Hymenobacter sp. M29]MDO7845421.1 hypothetical protein [Hymenobacter sp. M29]
MKILPLIYACGLLAMTLPTHAFSHPQAAPADTIAGHSRMVRKLTDAMCTGVTNDRSVNFDKMSPAEAMQFTQGLFVKAMQRDSVAFMGMITAASKQGQSSQQVGQALGKDVMMNLANNCPAAMPLVMRLSQTEQVQQAANAKLPTVTDVERKTLQPMATHLCTQLDAANAKQAFDKMPTAQRAALFNKLIEQEFLANRTKLQAYYSKAQLDDAQQREEIGKKIASLMMTQGSCAKYLIVIGMDMMKQQKP